MRQGHFVNVEHSSQEAFEVYRKSLALLDGDSRCMMIKRGVGMEGDDP
jgi:hypothetical protein